MENKEIIVGINELQAVVNYLISRPYSEVHQLIAGIFQTKKDVMPDEEPPAKTE